MAIIGTLPVTLQNATIADANQVMSDFNFIVNQVNANAAPLSSIISGSQLIGIQVFQTTGTYTPTIGTTRNIVHVIGGGGGGGGAVATGAGQFSIGAGGGAGGYVVGFFLPPVSGAITIGAAGAGGLGGAGAGANGGLSSYQGLLVANGGTGGGAAQGATIGVNGATGGTIAGAGNIVNVQGQPGGAAWANNSIAQGMSGFGGSTTYGSGGTSLANGNSLGVAATGFGGGGGGAFNLASQAARQGGNGFQGIIIIFDYA